MHSALTSSDGESVGKAYVDMCEAHRVERLYDTFGYPYCPSCEDEVWEMQMAMKRSQAQKSL